MKKISLTGLLIVSSIISLLCSAESSELKATVICEGEKGWAQCKQYEIIQIKSAFWGRDDSLTCPQAPEGLTIENNCETNPANTLNKVAGQCKNEQACEIVASNIFFDDNSCGNIYKFLKVTYQCIPDEANSVDILKEGG